ncbi:MAG: hypothetical protein WKF75_18320 [Singulisphaera sp.]
MRFASLLRQVARGSLPSWHEHETSRRRTGLVGLRVDRLEDRLVLDSSWFAQGPAPQTGAQVLNLSPNNSVSGAIEAIVTHPTDADLVYVGAVNGGVWRTRNATSLTPTWTPLTDQLPSLSIGALERSPLDPDTLYASTGSYSSLSFDGGAAVGIYKTTDGGDTWSHLGRSVFAGLRIRSVAPSTALGGQLVLAGVTENFANRRGVFRSTDGGVSWTRASGSGGLPDAAVSRWCSTPAAGRLALRFRPGQGVYRTTDEGLTWTAVNAGSPAWPPRRIHLSIHNSPGNNVIYSALLNGSFQGSVQAVFRSTDQGNSWTQLGTSPLNNNSVFTPFHSSFLADPTLPNIVFLAGSSGTHIWRGDAATNTWSAIVGAGANNTSPHVDSRAMRFDVNGNLLEGDDGGIARLRSPNTPGPNRRWVSANGTLNTTEFHSGTYDPLSNVVFGGTQDNGTPEQITANNLTWRTAGFGDGGVVAVDADQAAHPGTSIRYVSSQNLGGWQRRTYNASNTLIGTATVQRVVVSGRSPIVNIQFYQPYELNQLDPARLLLATTRIYESFNRGDAFNELGVDLPTDASSMAYGGRLNGVDNLDVFYVAAGNQIRHRATSGGPITILASYPGGPRDLAMDPENWQRLYVLDTSNRVWATFNAGTTWVNISGNVITLSPAPDLRTIEIVSRTASIADDIVLVAGVGGVFAIRHPALGGTALNWGELGQGLPNALIRDLRYDPADDLVVIASQGRGAWTIFDPDGVLAGRLTQNGEIPPPEPANVDESQPPADAPLPVPRPFEMDLEDSGIGTLVLQPSAIDRSSRFLATQADAPIWFEFEWIQSSSEGGGVNDAELAALDPTSLTFPSTRSRKRRARGLPLGGPLPN